MQKIDDCKEIRLALTRAGIATCPEKCLQTFRLVVTAQYIYHSFDSKNMEPLYTKHEPQSDDDMVQYAAADNWM
jgi:hypothetical protein